MHYYKKILCHIIFLSMAFWLMSMGGVFAQNRSRIAGMIKDVDTREALPGVNIIIENTSLGAASNASGQYVIINVPVGTYRLRASMMGYEAKVFTNVMVSVDRITKLDFFLKSTVIQGSEVKWW